MSLSNDSILKLFKITDPNIDHLNSGFFHVIGDDGNLAIDQAHEIAFFNIKTIDLCVTNSMITSPLLTVDRLSSIAD